jgi:hypothetical protein
MITVSLRLKDLKDRDACREGKKYFRKILSEYNDKRVREGKPVSRILRVPWTPLHALWAAQEIPDFHSWLIDNRLIPLSHFQDLDLSNMDLSGAYLPRSNFCSANLSGVSFANAGLIEAIFEDANLRMAHCSWADFRGADFRRADLFKTSFIGTDLSEANFTETDISTADFTGACRNLNDPHLDGWECVTPYTLNKVGILRRK